MSDQIKQKLKAGIAPDRFYKRIRMFGAITIGVGALMGGGIYVLIGLATQMAGPSVCLSFLLCGALAFLTTMVFSEIGAKITIAGGGYAYSYSALGSLGGFATGWFLAIGSIFACSLYAIGFSYYLLTFFSPDLPGYSSLIFSTVIIIALVCVSVFFSESNKIQFILTWGNVIILCALCIGASLRVQPSNLLHLFPHGISGTLSAISVIYVSFFGFQLIANNSTEIISANKTVPKAMKFSMIIVWGIYILVALAAVSVLPWQQIAASDAPLTVVADSVFGGKAWIMMALGGILASAGALNSTLFSQGRQIYAMGKHRFLPDLLGEVNKKSGIPLFAIFAGGCGAIVAVWTLNLEFIAKSANFCLLASMIPVCLSLRKLYNAGEISIPRSIWKKFLPEIALIANVAMIFSLDWISLVFGQQLALIGAFIYIFYSRKREKRSKNAFHVVLSDPKKNTTPLFGTRMRLLMPMANPERQAALFSVSNALLKSEGGEIIALSIAKSPDDKELHETLSWADHSIEMIKRSADFAKNANISIKSIIRTSNNIPMGIVHAAEEEACRLIVMGYSGHKAEQETGIMRSVLKHAKSDVIFINSKSENQPITPKRIAVSLAGRINLDLMVTLAGAFAETSHAKISFLNILPPHFRQFQRERADKIIIEALQKLSTKALYDVCLFKSDNPLETLIEQSAAYDLLIAGTTKTGLRGKAVIGDFAEHLSIHSKCDVAIVRALPMLRKILRVI